MVIARPFHHDCESCTWVGWLVLEKRAYNIYVHDYKKEGGLGLMDCTLIMRYGDEPSEYLSMPFPGLPKGDCEFNDSPPTNVSLL